MVNLKLLSPTSGDVLDVMGLGPPIPWRRCKIRTATGKQHTGQEPE